MILSVIRIKHWVGLCCVKREYIERLNRITIVLRIQAHFRDSCHVFVYVNLCATAAMQGGWNNSDISAIRSHQTPALASIFSIPINILFSR